MGYNTIKVRMDGAGLRTRQWGRVDCAFTVIRRGERGMRRRGRPRDDDKDRREIERDPSLFVGA